MSDEMGDVNGQISKRNRNAPSEGDKTGRKRKHRLIKTDYIGE